MAFIMDVDGNLIGKLEDYETFSWSRQLFNHGIFSLTINQNQFISDLIEEGNFILPDELGDTDLLYSIEQIEKVVDEGGRETELLEVSGRQFGGIFENRIILPPENNPDLDVVSEEDDDFAFDNQSGFAESVMKHYINYNGGESTSGKREIPNLFMEPDLNRGEEVSYKGRFQRLSETLNELGKDSNLGWEVRYDIDFNLFRFDVIEPLIRIEDVVFDIETNTATAMNFLRSELGLKTFAYIGGDGEGRERIIESSFLAEEEPEGFQRREAFVDGGGITDESELRFRGRIYLRQRQREEVFEIVFNPVGDLRYRIDWDLGNIVKIINRKWNIDVNIQIVGVTVNLSPGVGEAVIDIQLGDLYPTIKTQADLEYGEDDRERV